MIHKLAQFTVREGKLDSAESAIRAFVSAVKASEPDTVIYAAFKKPDGYSFVHIMSFRDEEAERRHRLSEHAKLFTSALYPLCVEPPSFVDLALIGSNTDSIV
ncbi:MAG: hypothetical protein A3C84_04800 [Candidatus Ryanbacteria bacterium RIFCSPHIGHO2_02_FULL_48_12]|uniref:ABM domain-containing protein n=1 Tax=Candidatus Ryanbacteria bacterium RIFCSPHIGHO2_01_FULL_48_27 TaxID=1802115 RepID=A0A1G2G6S0_9BACT|nr:MAG: hypothetical protein A2756_00955 [Candidatus Ryanbacteria bacterium RIFCSPHIGHO2_01_FULL_48_27]OGZ48370.1 MAG: hypothetical protein A3C84_04800 [Candidatus Ryanbacteria bacterium RIFCSPHIGHO2_02_FULL_48_12]